MTLTADITLPLGEDRDTESAARGKRFGNHPFCVCACMRERVCVCTCWGKDESSKWGEWSVIVTFTHCLVFYKNSWKSVNAFESKMMKWFLYAPDSSEILNCTWVFCIVITIYCIYTAHTEAYLCACLCLPICLSQGWHSLNFADRHSFIPMINF